MAAMPPIMAMGIHSFEERVLSTSRARSCAEFSSPGCFTAARTLLSFSRAAGIITVGSSASFAPGSMILSSRLVPSSPGSVYHGLGNRPSGSRTQDLWLIRPSLLPTELRVYRLSPTLVPVRAVLERPSDGMQPCTVGLLRAIVLVLALRLLPQEGIDELIEVAVH